MSKITQKDVAEKLLWSLWRCVDDLYKQKYLTNIWEQFENAIRSASYTNSLKKFISHIVTRIPITVQAKYQKDVLEIVDSGEDERVLDWLRAETTYMVMLVRVMNQERREEYEAVQNEIKEDV